MDEKKIGEAFNWIKENIEILKTGQMRLELKIDKIDSEHDVTKEKQTELRKDFEYLSRDQMKFVEKYDFDRQKIYDMIYKTNSETLEKSKLEARNAFKDSKIWVYAGLVAGLVMLVTILSKIK
jgi:hypothetical protein